MSKSIAVIADEMTANVEAITEPILGTDGLPNPLYAKEYNKAIAGPIVASGVPTPIPIESFTEDQEIVVDSLSLTPLDLGSNALSLNYVLGSRAMPQFSSFALSGFTTIHAADYGLSFGAGIVLLANGTKVQTSTDGYSWSPELTPTIPDGVKINGNVIFGCNVFLAADDGNKVIYSLDGMTWMRASVAANLSVAFAYGHGGNFLLASADVTQNYFKSSDIIDWSSASIVNPHTTVKILSWRGSFYLICSDGSIYCVPGDLSGAIFSLRTGSMPLVSATQGAGTIVAVSSDGRITYSSDQGVTWTDVSIPGSPVFSSVAWGAGVFVAAGSGQLFGSFDGATWQSIGTTENASMKMIYAIDKFIGVLSSGTNRLVVGVVPGSVEWRFV